MLKGKKFWLVKVPQMCSWAWRKVLKMREEVGNCIHFNIGDGNDKIFLLLDKWHPEDYFLAFSLSLSLKANWFPLSLVTTLLPLDMLQSNIKYKIKYLWVHQHRELEMQTK